MDAFPAQLDELRNRIQPPSKIVLFNSKLVHNDGVLVAAIAQAEQLNYAAASTWLADAISELHFRLKNKETVILAGIGTMETLPGGQIIFSFNGDAVLKSDVFGLKPLSLQIAEKDNVDKVRRLVAADGPVATAARTVPLKRVARLAAAAAIIGLLMWIPFKNGINESGKMAVQQLNPFLLSTETTYTPRNFKNNWLSKGLETPNVFANKFGKEFLSISLSNNSLLRIVVKTDVVASTEIDTLQPEQIETKVERPTSYQVIAATFSSKIKATDHLVKMIKRGFSAQYVGKDSSGHHVAYGSYNSLADAEKMLSSVSLSNKQARIVLGN